MTISLERNSISIERNNISRERNIIAKERNGIARESNISISRERNSISRERNNICISHVSHDPSGAPYNTAEQGEYVFREDCRPLCSSLDCLTFQHLLTHWTVQAHGVL